jgi:hypothetical protein
MKSDPPAECKELGSVSGNGSLENAKIYMRNDAAAMGGNYVRWETVESNGTTASGASGTAYKCPEPTATTTSAQVPAGR